MASKVLFLTGGTGMVGLSVVEEIALHKSKWAVNVLYRNPNNLKVLHRLLAKHPSDNEFKFVQGDITDLDSLRSHIPEQADAVLHMAATTSQWSMENEKVFKVNVEGTRNVIDACLEKKVKKLVYTSSISAYAPQHRSHVNEGSPKLGEQHVGYYNRTKFWSELDILQAVKERDLPACILNPCQIIGKYDTGAWVGLFQAVMNKTMPILGRGNGCFASVKEVAKAHISAIENGRIGENYILGGPPRPFADIAAEVLKLQGEKYNIKIAPSVVLRTAAHLVDWYSLWTRRKPFMTPAIAARLTSAYSVDSSKARNELGYDDAVPFESMVQEEYNWVLNPTV